jgi:AraC-like DNA-binding protein
MHVQTRSDDSPDRTLATLTQKPLELAALIERFTGQDGVHQTAIAPLILYRSSVPSGPFHEAYSPAVIIVAQGSKQIMLADEQYVYTRAHYVLFSVDLPVVGYMVEATPEAPYLSLRLDLEPMQIGTMIIEAGLAASRNDPPERGLSVGQANGAVLDAVVRLLRLLETPQDIPMLVPLVLREILYRLLMSEQGTRLRQMALASSHTQRVAKIIHWIRRNYTQPLRIEALAREVHMSPSALHHHFKAVTAMSPLQYQKLLRLQEARRLMLSEDLDAATAGYYVGYGNPSQFSREYRRLFGAPPRCDIEQLRSGSNSHTALGR